MKLLSEGGNEEVFETPDEELREDVGEEEDEAAHSKLISKISTLNEQKKEFKWKAARNESSKDIDEFGLTKKTKSRVQLIDLIKSAQDDSGRLKRALRKLERKKLLEKPLEKTVSDAIKRRTNYESVKKQVSRWEGTVKTNRKASQLVFPLKQTSLRIEPIKEVVKDLKPKTELEIQVNEILKNSQNVLTEEKPLTEAEEKFLKAMSLEEAKIRHQELQKMRALISYQEARLKRQGKIKSKKYHRILKREKLKNEMKQFEEEKEKNPQLALDKLEELDKLRILERASLKHRNTGKWAKHHKLRVKYDDEARKALNQQLELSKKLSRKVTNNGEDGDNDDVKTTKLSSEKLNFGDNLKFENSEDLQDYNPWLRNVSEGKALEREVNDIEQKKKKNLHLNKDEQSDQKELMIETNKSIDFDLDDKFKSNDSRKNIKIDPNNFMKIEKKSKYNFPNLKEINEVDDNEDNEEIDLGEDNVEDSQRKLIAEAFAEDDVVNDFEEEKNEISKRENNKDVNLYLPGWGVWDGCGIKKNARKRKKFTVKATKKIRKDANIGNVIISEKKDEVVSNYKVNELPHPFKNVVRFEKSISKPIGNTWNTEMTFRSKVQPKIVTKMGAIIEPIDEDSMIKTNDSDSKTVRNRKKEKEKSQIKFKKTRDKKFFKKVK